MNTTDPENPAPFDSADPYEAPGAGSTDARTLTSEERNWAILSHVLSIVSMLFSGGSLGWLAPLIILGTKGERSPFVERHARAALNFQVTWVLIVLVVSTVTCGVGWLVVGPISFLLGLFCGVQGGLRADDGKEYEYPLTYPILKA